MLFMGNPCSESVINAMQSGVIGMIDTPAQGNKRPQGVVWCADNGCFGKGYPGDEAWREWLSAQGGADSCLFAVAPDVVSDAAATLARSQPHLAFIRSLGIKAAFVAQNGIENTVIPWDDFDCLFLGGCTEWKLGPVARAVSEEAKRRGKHLHMGRVNSFKRFKYAYDIGCDSVDGTYLTFGPDKNLSRLLAWIEIIERQTSWL